MDNKHIDQLLELLPKLPGGFANYCVFNDELQKLLHEVKAGRALHERVAQCPRCTPVELA